MPPNLAKHLRRAAVLPLLLLLGASGSAVADQEVDQLRAENLRLKEQLQVMQRSCPSTAALPATDSSISRAPASPNAAAVGVSSAAPAASNSAPLAVGAPIAAKTGSAGKAVETARPDAQPADVMATGNAAPAAAAVPKGYKLVPVNTPDYVDPMAPPYTRTGCSRDLFSGPPPAKWNEADNWRGVRKGESAAEVEGALGKEHFDAAGRGLVEWQYGKCGDVVGGRVLFQNGQVVSWQVPDL
jgi:hypothetical protein